MYRCDNFKLIINDDEQKLLYYNEIILDNCQDIMSLMVNLGISDEAPQELLRFNLTKEELADLEHTLVVAILGDSKCMPDIKDDLFE